MSIINVAYFSDLYRAPQVQKGAEEVCIANISPLERQKRLRFGVQQFVITLIVLAILIALHVNPLWRLSLLPLFWASTVGYFQARDKT
ncbi:MAG TPA: hypothetical protein VK909_18105 [Anaerolineales bacterium]|nr:hypothetical protein [Anaerolineales bacterium]